MSNVTKQTGAVIARANSLWAGIGVLSVVVVALASALYFVQTKKEDLKDPHITGIVSVPVVTLPTDPGPEPEPAAPPLAREKKPAAVKRAQPASKPVVSSATPAATPAPAKAVCLDCGTVTAVTPIEREGTGSGAGAVAGGVLGAVVGNQVGQGQGKDVATILGAIGGGFAGNAVEKKMKKETVFMVQLRMDDGSTRSLEQAAPAGVGARVRVKGDTLEPLPSAN